MVAVACLVASSCGFFAAPPKVADLTQEFVYTTLSFSPVTATGAGYRMHNGVPLDELLDSFETKDLEQQHEFYRAFRKKLDRVRRDELGPEDAADWAILSSQTDLQLLEFERIQSYRHNPTLYVELLGRALFDPFALEYASLDERYKHIVARLNKVPQLLGQARQNLTDAPELWTQVAARENDGNRDLIQNVLRPNCPVSAANSFDRPAREALRAIDEFTEWLRTDLAQRKRDWKLGEEVYNVKFAAALAVGQTPRQVLADAEAELKRVRGLMEQIAVPLRQKGNSGAADPVKAVREALDEIAQRHATRQEYFDHARRDLEEARQFVRESRLVGLPARDNLKVIETPEFMRGIYSVGGFNPAPPLQPKLGAFYWLTPIPDNWEAERVESKLREYNHYGLKLLTIHEAIPGHYLQFEYANDVQPQARRVLRALYGNNPYVEGWAVYATEAMVDAGYLGGDPALRLTWYKQYLRAVANTILDIRMQTGTMTDEAAMRLMIEETFQEKEEATAKLTRTKLSSAQLPTYFAGYRAWKRLADKVRRQRGSAFNLGAFHEQALRTGAVPMPELERILTGGTGSN